MYNNPLTSNFFQNIDSPKNHPSPTLSQSPQMIQNKHAAYGGNFHARTKSHYQMISSPMLHNHQDSMTPKREISFNNRQNPPLIHASSNKLLPKFSTFDHLYIPDSYQSNRTPTHQHQPQSQQFNNFSSDVNSPHSLMKSQMHPNLNTSESQQRLLTYGNFEKTLFESRIEGQIEKQNRVLTRIVNTIAQQEQKEKERYHKTMGQKIKELELDRTRINLELERQKFKQLQTLSESPKRFEKPPAESPPTKKGTPYLQEVLMGLLIKKTTSPKNNNVGMFLNPLKSSRNAEDDEESVSGQTRSRKDTFKSSIFIQDPSIIPSRLASKRSSSLSQAQQGQDQLIMDNDSPNSRGSDNSKRRGGMWNQDEVMRNSGSEMFGRISNIDSVVPRGVVAGRRAARIGSAIGKTDGKRKIMHAKLAGITWMMIYLGVLYNEKKKNKMREKESFEGEISSKMAEILDMSKKFINDSAGKEILKMVTDTGNSGYILANLNEAKAKKCQSICSGLMAHLKLIFNKLIVNLTNIPKVLLQQLKMMIKDNGFLQNGYFSLFEINRLKFGPFGTIREMTPPRIKLIIGGILIMRVMIHYFVMRPWEVFPQDKSKFKTERLLNMGSVMYNVVMMIFKGTIPANLKNQNFLPNDLKLIHRKNPNLATDQPVPGTNSADTKKEGGQDGEIIEGFYSINQMPSVFEHNKKLADELKRLIVGFLDALYEKVISVN